MLEGKGSIDVLDEHPHPSLATSWLFGEQRGKMFGILECVDRSGNPVWLYGYSGQFNGHWKVPGWVPPLFDTDEFSRVHDPVEARIKEIGTELNSENLGSLRYDTLARLRRRLSRELMATIHELYYLHNFRGERSSLHEAFNANGGKPTGTGDCCAPKLLNFAALSDLVPLSIAEFYFGRANRSNSRQHGRFYAPCSDKCVPLLGFLLCGINKRRQDFEA